MAGAAQFVKNQNAPEQSPELIGVGERNAAADADILRGVLLKQISEDPDEAAQHQPEEHRASADEFMPEWSRAAVGDGQHASWSRVLRR